MLLNIPNPCQENWAEMTPEEQGRFCQVCQKTVIDFTEMPDSQVVKTFEEHENLCGRFKVTQLNRALSTEPMMIQMPSRLPAWKTMVMSLLTAGALMGCNDSYTQGEPKKLQGAIQIEKPIVKGEVVAHHKVNLKGVVFDNQQDTEISGAKISLKGTNITTHTDANGYFEITIPENFATEKMTFIVEKEGYEVQYKVVKPQETENLLVIKLDKNKKEPISKPIEHPPILMGKPMPPKR